MERRAVDRYELERARRGWVQLAADAWQRDRRRGGPLLSGGLAYRIFLWQVPAMLFFVSLLGFTARLAAREPDDLARQAGMSAALAGTLSQAVSQTSSSRIWLLLIGAWLTVWAARSAWRAIRVVSQIAWGLPLRTRGSLRASLAFSGYLLGGTALLGALPAILDGPLTRDVAVWSLVTLLLLVYVAFAMSRLPHRGSWTGVLPGALVFTLGARGLSIVTTVYLAGRLDRVDDLYGSLAIAIVLLLYLYLLARLFVGGQFLNATLWGHAHGHEPGIAEGPGSSADEANASPDPP